ncbi:MAG: hypothetical protein KAU31_03705, partial [Spirochaetaceae bacterium]|nr:hypothetical protein [Spirochaetaceae bacterium]
VVYADGTPVAVYHELNGDGLTDVAILTVLDEPGVPTELANLRETSRIFRTDDPNPLFVLETYFAGHEAVQTVELGRKPALGGMELLQLSEGSPFPVAIAVRMRSSAGTENNLIIYSPGGMIRQLQLQETARERYQLTDLDQNGTMDIVVTRRLPEAGRGYETFLELLTLDGNSYISRASFGLVRELQEFLNVAANHISAARWEALEELVRADGADDGSLLSRAFQGVAEDEEGEESVFDYPEIEAVVTAVVLPVFLENPFPYPYFGTHFKVVFRVECSDGYPRFFSAIVELSEYPFDEPRFAFLTRGGTQR